MISLKLTTINIKRSLRLIRLWPTLYSIMKENNQIKYIGKVRNAHRRLWGNM